MSGTSQYERAKRVLKEVDGQTLELAAIQYIIKTRLASGLNRVEQYEKLMKSTGLIKEVADSKFEVWAV